MTQEQFNNTQWNTSTQVRKALCNTPLAILAVDFVYKEIKVREGASLVWYKHDEIEII